MSFSYMQTVFFFSSLSAVKSNTALMPSIKCLTTRWTCATFIKAVTTS